MTTIYFTPDEKSELEKMHRSCRDRKEGDRIKAVLLRSEDWTIPMISQALRIGENTVSRHLKEYQDDNKLSIESGGSSSALNEAQTTEIISHLESNTYERTSEIISHINDKYDIVYSVPGINKWLHRNGFSYKKPKGTPYKADKDKQAEFIEKYVDLKNELKSHESIMFMDSCHPSMATKVSCGWIKRGKDKPISTTASRTRINIVGALDLNNISETITSDYDTINSESIVSFLSKLRKNTKNSGVINLILDGAGYHRSEIVRESALKFNIKLHFLPPYSPNLNPIERLWKVMNEYARNNRFFSRPIDFRQSINNFLKKTLPDIGHKLNTRINDNFQKLDLTF